MFGAYWRALNRAGYPGTGMYKDIGSLRSLGAVGGGAKAFEAAVCLGGQEEFLSFSWTNGQLIPPN